METNEQAGVEVSSNTDNSDYSQENISNALNDEPVNTPEGTQTPEDNTSQDTLQPSQNQEEQKQSDNTEQVPDKFKNQEGSADVNKVLKSYKELESYKSTLEKERADLQKEIANYKQAQEQQAKDAGFNSMQDMKEVYELANLEANEYYKYIQYADDPDTVTKMLQQYIVNPSKELMEEIELEFSPRVNKQVAVKSEQKKYEYQAKHQQEAETKRYMNMESIIQKSVDENKDLFNYEPVKQLYVNTLSKFGDNFTFEDSQSLMKSLVDLKDAFYKEFEKNTGTKVENDKAKDKISAISGQNSAQSQALNPDISNMSDKDIAKLIRDLL